MNSSLARRAAFALIVTVVVGIWYPTLKVTSRRDLLPRWQTVSAECRAAFDRDLVIDPAAASSSQSFVWTTTACPNGTYYPSATFRDAAGNTTKAKIAVTVLNLDRVPLTTVLAPTKLYPAGGYVELLVRDTKRRQFGLSLPALRFEWSVAVQFGTATVIERGLAVKTLTAPTGVTLRIAIEAGRVRYYRNGVEVYVSSHSVTEAVAVEVALEDATTVLGHLTIAGGSS